MAEGSDVRTEGIKFDVIITNDGVKKAQDVLGQVSNGWHLTPLRFAIAEYSGAPPSAFDENLKTENYIQDLNNDLIWHQGEFSGVYGRDKSELLVDIVVPAKKYAEYDSESGRYVERDSVEPTISKKISRIYMIFENYSGDNNSNNGEFLFAVAQPSASTGDLYYIPGTVLGFKFLFALENEPQTAFINGINLEYTWVNEIEHHNDSEDAHSNLFNRMEQTIDSKIVVKLNGYLKADGSIKATNLLSYTSDPSYLSLIDKEISNYTSADRTVISNNSKSLVTYGCLEKLKVWVNTKINNLKTDLEAKIEAIRLQALPVGSIIMWAGAVLPSGFVELKNLNTTHVTNINKFGYQYSLPSGVDLSKLVGRFPQYTSTTSQLLTFQEASLPKHKHGVGSYKISGKIGCVPDDGPSPTGAVSWKRKKTENGTYANIDSNDKFPEYSNKTWDKLSDSQKSDFKDNKILRASNLENNSGEPDPVVYIHATESRGFSGKSGEADSNYYNSTNAVRPNSFLVKFIIKVS